jgi:hypothetical protein
VIKIQKSDSSKSGFSSFYSTVDTPTKKKPHHNYIKPLVIFEKKTSHIIEQRLFGLKE